MSCHRGYRAGRAGWNRASWCKAHMNNLSLRKSAVSELADSLLLLLLIFPLSSTACDCALHPRTHCQNWALLTVTSSHKASVQHPPALITNRKCNVIKIRIIWVFGVAPEHKSSLTFALKKIYYFRDIIEMIFHQSVQKDHYTPP